MLGEFLQHCQDHFITMLVSTSPASDQHSSHESASSEISSTVSWDRVDAFATALLAVVAADSQRLVIFFNAVLCG